MTSELKSVVISAKSAPPLHAYGDEVRILLNAQHSGSACTMFHDVTPPGGGPPPHFHLREDEWWYVIEGSPEFFDGAQWIKVGAGGMVFMARNSLHTFRNAGAAPMRQIIHTSPSGFETFFERSAAEFARAAAPDLQSLLQIGADAGIYFPTVVSAEMARRGQPSLPPAIIQPSEGRLLHAFGEEVRILLEGRHTAGKFTAFVEKTPPNGGPPPHFHEREDEWFHVLEGRLNFLVEDEWTEVLPGDTVFVPRETVHAFKNIGGESSKMLIHVSPSGFENFFSAAAAEFAKAGSPDLERIRQIAAGHGIHFLTP